MQQTEECTSNGNKVCTSPCSIECSPAVGGTAETGNLLLFEWELVVVRDLLVDLDLVLTIDYDLLGALHCNHLGIAVRLCVGRM